MQHLGGCRLPLVRLSQVLLRLGKLAGSLVELLLEIDRRGSVTTRSRRLLAAFRLRRPGGPSFHCHATPCTAIARGHATSAIDVTSDHPLMKPSHDAQNRARGLKGYHTRPER